jgi:hypothetical protein
MPNLSAHSVALAGNFYTSSATQEFPLGTKGVAEDGRVYRYCKAGASNLVAGNVIQSPAIVPNHLAATAPVVAAGATSFTFTPGATAGTVNQYAEGFLSVDTTPGNGYTYGIQDHAAFGSSTAFTLNLRKDDPIQVALTTSSRLGLLANPYNGVIQMPITTATGSLVGVASYIITAAQYGWIQTAGIASVLIAGTPALGAAVMAPGAAAGAAEVIVAAGTLIVAQFVGHMAQVGVSGKNNFVRLNIAE